MVFRPLICSTIDGQNAPEADFSTLLWPHPATLRVNRERAVQPLNVEIRVLPEHLDAVGTPAVGHVLPGMGEGGHPVRRFFAEAGWAHSDAICEPEVFLGLGNKQVKACLATKMVLLAVVDVRHGLVSADTQPDQGTATGRADECFHCCVRLFARAADSLR